MANVDDMKLFHNYIGAALPMFTCSHDCKHSDRSLCLQHGAVIRDFRFGAEMWFLGNILFYTDRPV